MGSSSAKHAKECATPPVPPKKYQLGSSSSKHAKELKILTETIEALALKLKKRDKQVRKLQENAHMLTEVSLKLESAEERLVEAVMDNKSMSICMKDLKSSQLHRQLPSPLPPPVVRRLSTRKSSAKLGWSATLQWPRRVKCQ
jgi:hypothetical protein